MEIITTHKNVDFDALASVFAAAALYPQAVPILPKSLNPNTRAFLSIHKELFPFKTAKEIDLSLVTRLIVVDTNSWQRLDGLTELFGVNKYAIIRKFKDIYHTTPGAFQLQLRVAHSKTMLAGGRSVQDVVCAMGFYDQAHFIREFKKMNGITPSSYQKLVADHGEGRKNSELPHSDI